MSYFCHSTCLLRLSECGLLLLLLLFTYMLIVVLLLVGPWIASLCRSSRRLCMDLRVLVRLVIVAGHFFRCIVLCALHHMFSGEHSSFSFWEHVPQIFHHTSSRPDRLLLQSLTIKSNKQHELCCSGLCSPTWYKKKNMAEAFNKKSFFQKHYSKRSVVNFCLLKWAAPPTLPL